jgi:hypothetical protein
VRLKALSQISAPAVEPVTLADALSFLRVDNAGEGALISVLLTSAREVVELYTGRALISQQLKLTMPNWESGYAENYPRQFLDSTSGRNSSFGVFAMFPGLRSDSANVIYLDRSPLISVDAVQYYDATETMQTLASSNYYALTAQLPGAMALKTAASWPDLFDRPDAVQISFTAGHGTTAATVPANLRIAVMMLAKHYYRSATDDDHVVDVAAAVNEIPFGVRDILTSRRVEGWVS